MPPTFYDVETTRHGVANGMETSWLPTGREAQTPTSALSVGRFCLMRGHAPHPIRVMCSSLHVQQRMTARMNFGSHLCVWAREGEYSDICSRLLFKNTCFPVGVQSQRKSRAVSQWVGVFGLGQGSLELQDPNSALGDSYSKPTHSSIKPWTTSTFLD